MANRGRDIDWVATLDIDGDNNPDALVGNAVYDGRHDMMLNNGATENLYAVNGQATSINFSGTGGLGITEDKAIVEVSVDFVPDLVGMPAGTSVELYLSNDDGVTWRQAPAGVLAETDPFEFNTFGNDLRFRVEMSAPEGNLGVADAALAPAAVIRPSITSIEFNAVTVTQDAYSRAGIEGALIDVDADTDLEEVVFQGDYLYPGSVGCPECAFEGRLRAIDSTDAGAGDINDSGAANLLYDAGSISSTTPGAASRVIYAVVDPTNVAAANRAVPFTTGEVTSPTTSTPNTLMEKMGFASAVDASAVVTFIRNGMKDTDTNRNKLRDSGHSTPEYVGPPENNSILVDFLDPDGTLDYEAFATTNSGRIKMLYVGSNSGMLHAFNALNGEEAWSMIPPNLVGRLKEQRRVDSNGVVSYNHSFFVDGDVRHYDVHDGSNWRSILVVGQALGSGSDGNNYYFAVDVTDPAAPLFLWEFSDERETSGATTCDRDDDSLRCTTTYTVSCSTYSCSSAANCLSTDPNHLYVPDSNGELVFELEHYNDEDPRTYDSLTNQFAADTSTAGYSGDAYMIATPAGGERCDPGAGSPSSYGAAATVCAPYMKYKFRLDKPTTLYPFVRGMYPSGSDDSLSIQMDNGSIEYHHAAFGSNSAWEWTNPNSFVLTEGQHVLTIYMREDGTLLDKLYLKDDSTNPGVGALGPDETCEVTCPKPASPTCVLVPSETCIDPDVDPWPGCGAGEKCCDALQDFCHPVANSCDTANTSAAGQTFSKPAVGRFVIDGVDRFLMIVGSGYNNRENLSNVGRSVYAVDVVTGEHLKSWNDPTVVDDLPYTAQDAVNEANLENTIPGGPVLVDMDIQRRPGFGYVDRIYVGDLEGRLWRIDTDENATLSAGKIAEGTGADYNWRMCNVFDAGVARGSDTFRPWAPIVTTPAAAVISPYAFDSNKRTPVILFGTGGDDNAPTPSSFDYAYRFYSVADKSELGTCAGTVRTEADLDINDREFVIGDGLDNRTGLGLPAPPNVEGTGNQKYWSDPVVIDNQLVAFASVYGLVDAVNPCDIADPAEDSEIFLYALINVDNLQIGEGIRIGGIGVKVRAAPLVFGPNQYPVATSTYEGVSAYSIIAAGVSDQSSGGEADAIKLDGTSFPDLSKQRSPIKFIRWREIPL